MRNIFYVALAVGVASVGQSAHAASYTFTDLGSLPNATSTSGNALNNHGQVTGYSFLASGSPHPFLYSNGTMQDLGTVAGQSFDYGESINDSGEIVGYGGGGQGWYSIAGGTPQAIPNLIGGTHTQLFGINDSGVMVGVADNASGFGRAIVYDGVSMQDLGVLPGDGNGADAIAIDSSGRVVGNAAAGPFTHAFLYSGGLMQDLGTLGTGTFSSASSIDGDYIAGYGPTSPSSPYHAWLKTGSGPIVDLGLLPGGSTTAASGVNAAGEVVGYATVAADQLGPTHAFVFLDGVMLDLNNLLVGDPGVTLSGASAINESGQIVANGGGHAFLLTPVSDQDSTVPEPSTILLLAPGLMILRRRLLRVR